KKCGMANSSRMSERGGEVVIGSLASTLPHHLTTPLPDTSRAAALAAVRLGFVGPVLGLLGGLVGAVLGLVHLLLRPVVGLLGLLRHPVPGLLRLLGRAVAGFLDVVSDVVRHDAPPGSWLARFTPRPIRTGRRTPTHE